MPRLPLFRASFRPAVFSPARLTPFPFTSRSPVPIPRNMSSSTSTSRKEFLCIIPDYPGSVAKRMEVRPYVFSSKPWERRVKMVLTTGQETPRGNQAACPGRLCCSGWWVIWCIYMSVLLTLTNAGGMFNAHPSEDSSEPPSFNGSAMIVLAESAEHVRRVMAADIYATAGVWDVEKASVIPVCFSLAFSRLYVYTWLFVDFYSSNRRLGRRCDVDTSSYNLHTK